MTKNTPKTKVYCKNCERLGSGLFETCLCSVPEETWYAKDDMIEKYPHIQNENNDCQYFRKKTPTPPKKHKEWKFWRQNNG